MVTRLKSNGTDCTADGSWPQGKVILKWGKKKTNGVVVVKKTPHRPGEVKCKLIL